MKRKFINILQPTEARAKLFNRLGESELLSMSGRKLILFRHLKPGFPTLISLALVKSLKIRHLETDSTPNRSFKALLSVLSLVTVWKCYEISSADKEIYFKSSSKVCFSLKTLQKVCSANNQDLPSEFPSNWLCLRRRFRSWYAKYTLYSSLSMAYRVYWESVLGFSEEMNQKRFYLKFIDLSFLGKLSRSAWKFP